MYGTRLYWPSSLDKSSGPTDLIHLARAQDARGANAPTSAYRQYFVERGGGITVLKRQEPGAVRPPAGRTPSNHISWISSRGPTTHTEPRLEARFRRAPTS